MEASIRAEVRKRAGNACEYCRLHQDDSPLAVLHIEHIIPRIHGGSDDLDNLALACVDCNLHKGTNLTGIDPETTAITQLFHPRRDKRQCHWRNCDVVGLFLVLNQLFQRQAQFQLTQLNLDLHFPNAGNTQEQLVSFILQGGKCGV